MNYTIYFLSETIDLFGWGVTIGISITIIWWLILLSTTALHFIWAWLNDGETRKNIIIEWCMLNILKFTVNPNREKFRYEHPIEHESDGTMAVVLISTFTFCIPIALHILSAMGIVPVYVVGIIATLYLTRYVIRIKKTLTKHINTINAHNKSNEDGT